MGKSFKILLILCGLLTLPVGVYLVTKAGPLQLGSKAGEFEEVMLFIMPAQSKMKQGETVNFAVKIDTDENAVSGGKILVNFDPLFLDLDGPIKTGSVFDNLKSQTNPGQVILNCQGNALGQGTVAVLPFKARGRGETSLKIGSSSVIWNEQGTTNILGQRIEAKVTIN